MLPYGGFLWLFRALLIVAPARFEDAAPLAVAAGRVLDGVRRGAA